MHSTDTFIRTANYLEACLWALIGVVVLVRAKGSRKKTLVGAVFFLLFGMSDIVEARTGAWFRPWWLLLWKGGCLAGILWWARGYFRARKQQ